MRHRTLALVTMLALAACAGKDGAGQNGKDGVNGTNGVNGLNGADGANGATGAQGEPGVSVGVLKGTLQYKIGTTNYPATAITVATLPDCGNTATSASDGTFELADVPVGVYSVVFTGTGFSKLQVDGVSVLAGKEMNLGTKSMTSTNPLVLTVPTTIPLPAGFGKAVTLDVNVTGGTAPYTYKWTLGSANPTAVTLSDATAKNPTFTTGSIKDIVAAKKAYPVTATLNQPSFGASGLRDSEFLAIGAGPLGVISYAFTVTVTDAQGYSKALTMTVAPATLQQGLASTSLNSLVIAYVKGNTGTLAFGKPATSTAVLNADADPQYAWFIPDVSGTYTVGTGASQLTVNAGNYKGSSPTCGGCHTSPLIAALNVPAIVDAKFLAWGNSAHGNHFFKYFDFDGTTYTPKDWTKVTDQTVAANLRQKRLPTANAKQFWPLTTGGMTTFQYGMTGAEGTHYGANCVACHTTGAFPAPCSNNVFNGACAPLAGKDSPAFVVSRGFDDMARTEDWVWPDFTKYFTNLGGDPAGDLTTPESQNGAWDLIPANVKKLAGMQCEACHGPLGTHATQAQPKVTGVYSVGACAICHERPSVAYNGSTGHDRVYQWRQTGHAKLSGAIAEAAIHDNNGQDPSPSCGRCHAAQGYVAWLTQQQAGNPGPINKTAAELKALGLTKQSVEPITCGACHDSHSTSVRIVGETGLLPAGFAVTGAGSGAVCMTCHNSRNGARSDALNGVYDQYSGSAVSAIGAPHEANQTDTYAGMNAFWVTNGKLNGHMAVSETCVGCHMKTAVPGLAFGITNHKFGFAGSTGKICGECHGEEVNGEALEARYVLYVDQAKAAIETAAKAALNAGTFYIKGSSSTVAVDPTATPVTAVSFTNGRSAAYTLTFAAPGIANPNAASPATVTTIKVAQGAFYTSSTTTPANLFFNQLTGRFAKANWNFTLVQDGSKSIHNPNFVYEVLQTTAAKVADTSITR